MAYTLARLVMVGTKVGVFDALAGGPPPRRRWPNGGVFAVLDEFRPASPSEAGQVGALLEFYFALTSQSGTWAAEEIAGWQRQAGRSPRRPINFRTAPGAGIQAAFKPG